MGSTINVNYMTGMYRNFLKNHEEKGTGQTKTASFSDRVAAGKASSKKGWK